MMTARQITTALKGRWMSGYGSACCIAPGHDDKRPSMKVWDSEDGPRFECYSGCDWRDLKDEARARGFLPERDGPSEPQEDRERRLVQLRADEALREAEERRKAEYIQEIIKSSTPLADTIGEIYLRERGLRPPWPGSLRYHGGLKHRATGMLLPCLIGCIRIWPDKQVSGITRIFLTADGKRKAPVSDNKLSLGRCAGGAVWLAPWDAEELAVSEGVEDALTVLQETGMPAAACCGTSGLQGLRLPDTVRSVVIAADNDEPGQKVAGIAAARFRKEGRQVRIATPEGAKDFNAALMDQIARSQQGGQAHA
ncbi:toprim domain-containing protein [Pelagibius sp. Alg239-R121]|uniref:DUF7146 domain-containing protein n=1 Tax=Pelagibius sp. Alg239-R121 TaxID=2993448 RepID=UPI0024A71E4E|nr:toprim domain-containing protein [Pelagibius sp. Alg239-R121]